MRGDVLGLAPPAVWVEGPDGEMRELRLVVRDGVLRVRRPRRDDVGNDQDGQVVGPPPGVEVDQV